MAVEKRISPQQFTTLLAALEIPTLDTSLKFTNTAIEPPKYDRANQASIEWHRESSIKLGGLSKDDSPRRFSNSERLHPLETIKELAVPKVEIDVYEKRNNAGKGLGEIKEKIIEPLTQSGYEPSFATIDLTDRQFLGFKKATVVFEEDKLTLQFTKLADKKFRDQVTDWLKQPPIPTPENK
jgi:hypothetical protein